MKSIYRRLGTSLIISTFLISVINAQDWKWGQPFTGDGDVEPIDIITGVDDQVLVVGTFTGTSLSIGSDSYTNRGDWDVFLACFHTDGSYLYVGNEI